MPDRLSALAYHSLRHLPRSKLSQWFGKVSDCQLPALVAAPVLTASARMLGMNLQEAEVPAGGFRSFDALFTRRLRPGVRPLQGDAHAVLMPADGRLEAAGQMQADTALQVKGRRYAVADLLDEPEAAAAFQGGSYAVIYLSPRDYHRVHAPVAGPVEAWQHIPGTLFPVNAIGIRHVPRLFVDNERMVVHQRCPHLGRVITVLVGAFAVGRIGLSFVDARSNCGVTFGLQRMADAPPMLQRGSELGTFHLGSTVVVLTQRSMATTCSPGALVQVGQALWQGPMHV